MEWATFVELARAGADLGVLPAVILLAKIKLDLAQLRLDMEQNFIRKRDAALYFTPRRVI